MNQVFYYHYVDSPQENKKRKQEKIKQGERATIAKFSQAARFKQYQQASDYSLMKKIPVIVSCKLKNFNWITDIEKDRNFYRGFMLNLMEKSFKEIHNLKFIYWQNNTLTMLLTDLKNPNTDAFHDFKIQEMVSDITRFLTQRACMLSVQDLRFIVRTFNLPESDVGNYFYQEVLDWQGKWFDIICQKLLKPAELKKMDKEEKIKLACSYGYGPYSFGMNVAQKECVYYKTKGQILQSLCMHG